MPNLLLFLAFVLRKRLIFKEYLAMDDDKTQMLQFIVIHILHIAKKLDI